MLRLAIEAPEVTMATVRGGSLALAMAGLLEGRTATTHVLGIDMLDAPGSPRSGRGWSTTATSSPPAA